MLDNQKLGTAPVLSAAVPTGAPASVMSVKGTVVRLAGSAVRQILV